MYSTSEVKLKNSKLFDRFLTNFQEDIKRIVGKFKKSFHVLSDQDIYSECNLYILKSKDRILDSFSDDQEFTESEFKKIAYHYVKNETIWSHYRVTNKAYYKRRVDGVVNTDDGLKSSFDIAIENEGQESHENTEIDDDESFLQFNSQQFFHILTEYSYLLTEQEVKVLSYIQAGESHTDIAERFGVSHQAISFTFVTIQHKLKRHFSLDEVLNGGSPKSLHDGVTAISGFFKAKEQNKKLTEADERKLQLFILNHPNKYTGGELNKKLFNNKYNIYKIWGAIKKFKLNKIVKRQYTPPTNEQKELSLKLYKEGKTYEKVAKVLGIKATSARRIREELVRAGKLEKLNVR